MDINEVRKLCLSLPGATAAERGEPNNILAFSVSDKKFAYFKTSEPEKWRFSVRVSPGRFLELTDQPGVKPARYMHRFHWVTIVEVGAFYEDTLIELIRWSYDKALNSLPKKIQVKIETRGKNYLSGLYKIR